MCVNIHATSALTVTLSKQAYEQLLKTLDNISYGEDIDSISDDVFALLRKDLNLSPVHQSASAPDLSSSRSRKPKKVNKNAPFLTISSK